MWIHIILWFGVGDPPIGGHGSPCIVVEDNL